MKKSERHMEATWVDDHLEAYLDGDLSGADRARVEDFLRADEEMRGQLQLAGRVRAVLAATDRPACPPSVTRAVLETARTEAADEARAADRPARSRRAAPRPVRGAVSHLWTAVFRPAVTMGVFILLVVASSIIGRSPATSPPATAENTPAEVQEALRETKWALSFVSDIGRRTGQSIREEVLEERVTAPVQRAVDTALRTEPSS